MSNTFQLAWYLLVPAGIHKHWTIKPVLRFSKPVHTHTWVFFTLNVFPIFILSYCRYLLYEVCHSLIGTAHQSLHSKTHGELFLHHIFLQKLYRAVEEIKFMSKPAWNKQCLVDCNGMLMLSSYIYVNLPVSALITHHWMMHSTSCPGTPILAKYANFYRQYYEYSTEE